MRFDAPDKTEADAFELSKQMTDIGRRAGKKVTAVISSMDQPLGMNIGNSLEVIEAIEVLKGNVKGDLYELSLTLGACMLKNAKAVASIEDGVKLLNEKIADGSGLKKLSELLINQSGSDDVLYDYNLLPKSKTSINVYSTEGGYISSMDTSLIGRASVCTCAGRTKKDDIIDYGAGIIMNVRIGDRVEKGEKIAEIFSKSNEKCLEAASFLQKAIRISQKQPEIPVLVRRIID